MNRKPRLMVVDNEIDICNFVKSFFEIRGFEVVPAYNGDDAMKVLGTFTPDLVILDVKMRREEEGLEYLPQIKQKLPGIKVLMITGVDDQDIIDRCMALGADDYITKPLVLEYLESTVVNKVANLSQVQE